MNRITGEVNNNPNEDRRRTSTSTRSRRALAALFGKGRERGALLARKGRLDAGQPGGLSRVCGPPTCCGRCGARGWGKDGLSLFGR